ncbi:MAG: tail fiber domain-containing protein [Bacteroidia bacterium]|nr:tail fiber domain-containing protein [Bacteroidia bacterium]
MKRNFTNVAVFLSVVFLFASQNIFSQGIGIGAPSFIPVASAILELRGADKGFLTTRVSWLSMPVSPADGLLVYVDAGGPPDGNGFYYYDGGTSTWKKVGIPYTAGTGINITGNTISVIYGAIAGTASEGNHTHLQLHNQQHAITSTTDHTAGNWKVFYSDGSNHVAELALGNSGEVLKSNGVGVAPSWQADAAGTGTVTSVGLSLPSIFTVTGSPVTTSGTLTGAFNNQNANTVLAGPAIAPAAQPTFRTLVAADLPTHSHSLLTPGTGLSGTAYDGSAAVSDWAIVYGGTGTANFAAHSDHNHSGIYDNYQYWTLQANGGSASNISSTNTVDFVGTGATTITKVGNTVTISSTDNNSGGDITGVNAGNGLTGGGLSGDVTLTLGTPSDISSSTVNSVTGTTHTHAIANSGVTTGTYNNLTVNAKGIVTAASNLGYLTSEVDGSITNELITAVSWTDISNLLRITEAGTNWDVTITGFADATHSHSLLTRGTGLTGSNYDGSAATTWAVDFGGTGVATTVSHSDHSHGNDHTQLHAMTSSSDHSATAWRIFYSNSTGAITELALGNASEVLKSNGVGAAPSWQTDANAGGTVTSFSAGALSPLFTTSVATATTTPVLTFTISNAAAYTVFGNNTAVAAAPTYFTDILASALHQNQGTTTTVLHGNAAGNPSWGQVSLTADVTGILPSANGGTGVNNAGTITNAANTTITGGGTLALGGFTLTVPATGTAALGTGTANYATYWSGANTLGSEQYLSVTRGGLGNNMTAGAIGAIPYATSTTAYGTLAAGTNGYFLKSNGAGTAPSWAADNNSGGTVTNIATSTGLTGGPITGTGTISMANMAALTVKGNPTNALAAPADIAATAASNNVFRESGSTLGFGSINLASSGAVGASILPIANGGTNTSSIGANGSILYSNGTSYQFLAPGTAGYQLTTNGAGLAPTWTAASSGPTGSGTADYLARWTTATNLGIGVTRDNNSTVGINTAPSASYRLSVSGDPGSGTGYFWGDAGTYVTLADAGWEGVDAFADQDDGVQGTTSNSSYYGVYGNNTNAASGTGVYGSGLTNGVWGVSAGASGAGVYGYTSGATGYGVYGWNNAAAGAAIGFGGYFTSNQTGGSGVASSLGTSSYFAGTAVSGVTVSTLAGGKGVIGACDNATGVGVQGQTGGASGTGVFGYTTGATGEGVYGWNNAAAGAAIGFGGWFLSYQTGGAALVGTLGLNSFFAGTAVSGITVSTLAGGKGGLFACDNATGTGVSGQSSGTTGIGVTGFTSGGGNGVGVYGSKTGAGGGYGGYFTSAGTGLYATTTVPASYWGIICGAGSALASGQTWSTSDRRFKKDISSLGDGTLDKIMKLKPSEYYYNIEKYPAFAGLEGKRFGLIAQEVEEIFPELVNNKKYMPDPTLIPDEGEIAPMVKGYYAVDYVSLIPFLIKGMQEQQQIITKLQIDIKVYDEGTRKLNNGKARVNFDASFTQLIGDNKPVVTITPMGQCNGIYISSVDSKGFEVTELNNGNSSVEFSYILIGKRINAGNKTVLLETPIAKRKSVDDIQIQTQTDVSSVMQKHVVKMQTAVSASEKVNKIEKTIKEKNEEKKK